jgi:hypothetical protein
VNSEHGEQEKTDPTLTQPKPLFANASQQVPTVSGIDHDLRRDAEVAKALAAGDVKAARASANKIRGRKEQKAADHRIDEYVAAHTAGEVSS